MQSPKRKVAWFLPDCLFCQLTLTWGQWVGQWIFSRLLNPDWSIQMSRAPAVCKEYGSGGKIEISLNCYNSKNICHSEERFSVLESPSHALSDDIFGGLKLENLYTTFLWHHQTWRHNMTFWHFCTLEMIKIRIQGSVQSLVREYTESANLHLQTFKVILPRSEK